MHLVDTSVWIHALRPEGSPAVRSRLSPMIVAGEIAISDWIILELMTGLRRGERPEVLLHRLEPVHRLELKRDSWQQAWEHAAMLRRRGVSPTAADCLIATLAIAHQVPLVHCDADFEEMKSVLPLRTIDWSSEVR